MKCAAIIAIFDYSILLMICQDRLVGDESDWRLAGDFDGERLRLQLETIFLLDIGVFCVVYFGDEYRERASVELFGIIERAIDDEFFASF